MKKDLTMKKEVKVLTDDEFKKIYDDAGYIVEKCERCSKYYSRTLKNYVCSFCPKCVPKQSSGYAMCPQLDPKITPVTKEFLNSDGTSFLYGWNTGIIYGEKDWWEFDGKREIRKAPPVMFQRKQGKLKLTLICDKFGLYCHIEEKNNYQMCCNIEKTITQKEAIKKLHRMNVYKIPKWFLGYYDFVLEFESEKDLMYDCEKILGKKG